MQRVSYRRSVSSSGQRVPGHPSSGQCVPRHLPSRRGESGYFSFWTQCMLANVLQMTHATASAFWTSSVRAFFLPNIECQGKCTTDDACQSIYLPDDARHTICLPDVTCHGICLLDQLCQGIFPSGCRVSRQMYYRRRVPRHLPSRRQAPHHLPSGQYAPCHLPSGRVVSGHLPSGRVVSGHFSFRMQSVMTNIIGMMCATASAFCTSSVTAFFLADAECDGKCTPDDACHHICLPDKECQSIFPSGHTVS